MLFVGVTTRWTKVNRAAVEPFWAPDGGKADRLHLARAVSR